MSAAQDALNLATTMQTASAQDIPVSEREFRINVANCLVLLAEAALSGTPSSEVVAPDIDTGTSTEPVTETSTG